MKQLLQNFKWQREDEPQNMLAYIFLTINVVYGTVFVFFPDAAIVVNSAFFMSSGPHIVWGLVCYFLSLGTLYTIAKRPRFLGESMGFLGVISWCYGAGLNLAVGSWFIVLVVYIPQVLFWTFWYVGVKRYYKKQDMLA